MEWSKYEKNFREIAQKHDKNEKYCEKWIGYAKKLWEHNVPIVYNQEHLSKLVGYAPVYVYAASNSPEHFYRVFEISKKSGGKRQIAEPLPSLKEIQKWILHNVLVKMEVSPYAKAYIKGKSIKDNVRFHRNQEMVLSLDIHDFFGSLSSKLVYEKFVEVGYNEDVAMMFTGLCCLNGSLPQGAPTSAMLSNVLMKPFDDAIAAYTVKRKIRYTRYADDMTFSGVFDCVDLIRYVRGNLKLLNLKLNKDKTRLRKQGQQQEVTGVVVNHHPQMSKKTRKEIRKNIHYIKKYGVESHLEHIGENRQNYLQHLQGVIGYALFINPKDKELREYRDYLRELLNG